MGLAIAGGLELSACCARSAKASGKRTATAHAVSLPAYPRSSGLAVLRSWWSVDRLNAGICCGASSCCVRTGIPWRSAFVIFASKPPPAPGSSQGEPVGSVTNISPLADRDSESAAASCPATPRGGVRARLTTPLPGCIRRGELTLKRSALAFATSFKRPCPGFRAPELPFALLGDDGSIDCDERGDERGPIPWLRPLLRGEVAPALALPLDLPSRAGEDGEEDEPL
jgi:hypothetical protein